MADSIEKKKSLGVAGTRQDGERKREERRDEEDRPTRGWRGRGSFEEEEGGGMTR
jgi:hypothetical protein